MIIPIEQACCNTICISIETCCQPCDELIDTLLHPPGKQLLDQLHVLMYVADPLESLIWKHCRLSFRTR